MHVSEVCRQVLAALYKAQLLALSGQRVEALQALDGSVEQVTGFEEGTPRAAHLRLHFALLRTLCQLASGETGSLQQTNGEHAILDHRHMPLHCPSAHHLMSRCIVPPIGLANILKGRCTGFLQQEMCLLGSTEHLLDPPPF